MDKYKGQQRVFITHIMPCVAHGKYPAKAIVQEAITFSADIFGDGHDEVSASLFIKHSREDDDQEVVMSHLINDYWTGVYQPTETGFYTFRMEAWINHYASWLKGLKKKIDAGQNVEVDLSIGAALIEEAASGLPAFRSELLNWSQEIKESRVDDQLLWSLTNEVAPLLRQYRRKEFTAVSPYFELEVEYKKAGFSTWYELFPRSTAEIPGQHGTFKDVQRLLPRIAKMGFDVLYLPPIHPIGEKNRKGKNNSLHAHPEEPGSPWAIGNHIGGHKAIHPQLGTLEDFKALIQAANEFGIDIAMDIAYQCAPDHPYVETYPQWFKWRPDGTVQYAENPPKRYEDILPFDFETTDWQNLWLELKSVIDYWVTVGIRIFRIDNPHTKALAFWEWMIREVRKIHPEVLFLAEAFTRPRIMEQLAKGGFNQSYTYFTWRNTKYELESYLKELTQTEMRYYFRPNFWPNTPDILPPILSQGGENAHIMRLILAATLSSNYGIYGPIYEFGINEPYPGKEEYIDNEKYEIKHWNWHAYTRIGEIITRLNRIRKQHCALQTTWNIRFAETDNEQLLCYTKSDLSAGDRLIIAVNLDVFQTQGAYVKIPLKALGLKPDEPYQLYDLLSGDKYEWIGEWNYVQLNPYLMPAHLFYVTP